MTPASFDKRKPRCNSLSISLMLSTINTPTTGDEILLSLSFFTLAIRDLDCKQGPTSSDPLIHWLAPLVLTGLSSILDAC